MKHKTFFWFFLPTAMAMFLFIALPLVSVVSQSFHVPHDKVLITVENCDPFGCTSQTQIDHTLTQELYEADHNNHANTECSYVEKGTNTYFIRGEGMVKSKEDIGNIVIKTIENIPVLVKDVANIQFGSAPRYGAMTRNGEGEVVGGIVMMLKGANSAEVTKRVKERMIQIQKSLHLHLISVLNNPQATCFSEGSILGTGIRNGAVSAIKTQIKSVGCAIAAGTGPKFLKYAG